MSSQTSRQTIIPSTICPSVHPFLRAFCHTHTSVRGERSLPASSTLWKQSSEGSRPAPRSERTPPASFYLQPPGPSFGFQLHGKTFGAAANVPPLHLLLPPLSPDQGRMVRRVDLFYPLQLKGCLFATKKKKNTSVLHLVSVSKPSRETLLNSVSPLFCCLFKYQAIPASVMSCSRIQ